MKGNRILVVLVIILIVINCALLSLLWFNVYHIKKRTIVEGPAFDFLSRELKLTDAQKSQYEKMRIAHANFADSVNTQTRMMRDSFFNYLKDPATKPEVINVLEKRISDNTAKMDTSTFYHFRKFRAILTPGQQAKFDDVIQDVLHSMGGGRPPQGGPPMGGGRGDMPPGPSQGRDMQHPGSLHRGPEPRDNGMQHLYGPPPGEGLPPGRRGPRPGMPPPGGPPPDGGRPGGGPPPNGGPPPQN